MKRYIENSELYPHQLDIQEHIDSTLNPVVGMTWGMRTGKNVLLSNALTTLVDTYENNGNKIGILLPGMEHNEFDDFIQDALGLKGNLQQVNVRDYKGVVVRVPGTNIHIFNSIDVLSVTGFTFVGSLMNELEWRNTNSVSFISTIGKSLQLTSQAKLQGTKTIVMVTGSYSTGFIENAKHMYTLYSKVTTPEAFPDRDYTKFMQDIEVFNRDFLCKGKDE